MIVYVSSTLSGKTIELLDFLDDRDIAYEVVIVSTEWVGINKVKSLPVVDINGELLSAKKVMKKLKRSDEK